MNAPAVILIRPQMGENIGAVARAMNNFGLSELRLVAPRDGWPNPKAHSTAARAEHIIDAAKVYATFEEAIADMQLVLATTARPRDIAKRVTTPDLAAQELRAHAGNTALVFGPERAGIENSEITLCDAIITIPTAGDNSSLNLAQASVILGYEWVKASGAAPLFTQPATLDLAPKEEMTGMLAQLEDYLDKVDYFRGDHKKPTMLQNIKTMLLRGAWSAQEVRTFRGILRAIWERRLNA